MQGRKRACCSSAPSLSLIAPRASPCCSTSKASASIPPGTQGGRVGKWVGGHVRVVCGWGWLGVLVDGTASQPLAAGPPALHSPGPARRNATHPPRPSPSTDPAHTPSPLTLLQHSRLVQQHLAAFVSLAGAAIVILQSRWGGGGGGGGGLGWVGAGEGRACEGRLRPPRAPSPPPPPPHNTNNTHQCGVVWNNHPPSHPRTPPAPSPPPRGARTGGAPVQTQPS